MDEQVKHIVEKVHGVAPEMFKQVARRIISNLVGVGSFRPRNNSFCGRFKVVDFK